jgi:CubicO group peptidase (beta-lactamase class C family)
MRILVSFIFLTLMHQSVPAQPALSRSNQKRLLTVIDSLLNGEVNNYRIPGAVIAIKKDGNVIYKHAFGYANRYDDSSRLLAQPEKMTTEHLFDLASLTKVVGTTTSIMLLADKGLIHVDDPVGNYVPAFKAPDKKDITIRHLLTHTAGLIEWYPLFYRASTKQETFKLIGDLPLRYPVGLERHYSDLGFTILGQVIENVSGLSLDTFMLENVFRPLGMQHTGYNPLNIGRFKKIAATSHGNPYETRMVHDTSLGFVFKEIDPDQWNHWRTYTLRGEVNDGNAWYAEGGVCGAAGLFSTVDDLQKLVDMLMNKGLVDGRRFISAETITSFLTKDKFANGLGWMMDTEDSFMKNGPAGTFGHTGFTGTSIVVVPKYHLSIILLINRQNTGLLDNLQYYNVNPLRRQIFEAVMHYCEG